MYEFKDTEGQKQSAIDKYFDTQDEGLSIGEVAEYIEGVPTGLYAREPIAYLFDKIARKLGQVEPNRFIKTTFEAMHTPYSTEYIYDETLPLTMEEVRQVGIDHRYVGRFEQPMYGKVAVGEKVETEELDVTQQGVMEIIGIGTKPWVNILTPNEVVPYYATELLEGDILKSPQTITDLSKPIELRQTSGVGAGFEINNVPFETGKLYTIAFEYQVTSGRLNDINQFDTGYDGTNVYVNDELISTTGFLLPSKWAVGGGKHTYYMHFIGGSSTNEFIWRFNAEQAEVGSKVWVTNLNIYEGHIHPFREVTI